MHSGNYSLTDDERKTYCKLMQDMVEHVLNFPLEPNENEIYYKIQQVHGVFHIQIISLFINHYYDTIQIFEFKSEDSF